MGRLAGLTALSLLLALIAYSQAEEHFNRNDGRYHPDKNFFGANRGDGGSTRGRAGKNVAVLTGEDGKGLTGSTAGATDPKNGNARCRYRDSDGKRRRCGGGMTVRDRKRYKKRREQLKKLQEKRLKAYRKRQKEREAGKKEKDLTKIPEDDSAEMRKDLDNIGHLSSKTGEGEKGAMGSSRTADEAGIRFRGSDKKRNRRKSSARMKKCRKKYSYKKCKRLIYKTRRGNQELLPDHDKSKDDKQIGMMKDSKGKTYYYEVKCSPKKKKRDGCKGDVPSKLYGKDGTKLDCTSKKKGDTTENKCCNKRKNKCVRTFTDKDGEVSFKRGRVDSGKAKCYERKKPVEVKENGEVVQLEIEKVDCGLDSSGALNSNARKIKTFKSSASCRKYKRSKRKLTISKPKYEAEKKTNSKGTVQYEFPHCGMMSAWIKFKGFSSRERAKMIPKLAYQFTVNVKPAGSLKCQDEMTCTTSDKTSTGAVDADNLEGNNCYYCRMCYTKFHRKSGILKNSEFEKTCSIRRPPVKVKIQARICPIQSSDDAACHGIGKGLGDNTGYYKSKRDVYIKIAVFLRDKTIEEAETQYETEKASPFWKFSKHAYSTAYKVQDPLASLFSKGDKPPKGYTTYKGYKYVKDNRGTQLSCASFAAKYNIFGDDLTEFLDAYTTMQDMKGFLGGAKARCKKLEDRWYEEYGKKKSGGSSSSIFG